MLRIHFTFADLAGTRTATAADLGAETMLSLRALSTGAGDVRYHGWHGGLRRQWEPRTCSLGEVYVPELLPAFLCPYVQPDHRATAAVAASGADPDHRRLNLAHLARLRPLSTFATRLADDDPQARAVLGHALSSYQAAAIDPFWPQVTALICAERARTAGLAAAGLHHLLGSLHPGIRWKSPILEVDVLSGADLDVPLSGRGMLLQPTVFGANHPVVAGHDTPDRQLTLYYPVSGQLLLGEKEPAGVRTLVPLLGRTRTAVLSAIADSDQHTTGGIARRIGCSPASVSEHTAVLRSSGLIITRRDGLAVRHTLTELGAALLGAGD